MITGPWGRRVLAYAGPVDMRKGFDGLFRHRAGTAAGDSWWSLLAGILFESCCRWHSPLKPVHVV
jgi:hypothetical protein